MRCTTLAGTVLSCAPERIEANVVFVVRRFEMEVVDTSREVARRAAEEVGLARVHGDGMYPLGNTVLY